MSTTQTTYTRRRVELLKTVEDLKNICRQDRQKYAGFSNYTKRPLIEFILRGGRNINYSNTGGRSYLTTRARTGRNFSRTAIIQETDDYSQELTSMFESSTYENDYDSFEIDEEDDTFNSYPTEFEITKTVKGIEDMIKLNDDEGFITYESYKMKTKQKCMIYLKSKYIESMEN